MWIKITLAFLSYTLLQSSGKLVRCTLNHIPRYSQSLYFIQLSLWCRIVIMFIKVNLSFEITNPVRRSHMRKDRLNGFCQLWPLPIHALTSTYYRAIFLHHNSVDMKLPGSSLWFKQHRVTVHTAISNDDTEIRPQWK